MLTLRRSSVRSVLGLLFGSGSRMSMFRLHDTVAQEEHSPAWYFQSAGLAMLWNNRLITALYDTQQHNTSGLRH